MGAEERTLEAIALTRITLERLLLDPGALVLMSFDDVTPVDVEDVVTEILEYLGKTKDPIDEEAEG